MARKLTGAQEQEIARLYLQGDSTVHIAALFGVSRQCVRKVLLRKGTPIRSFSEARGGLSLEAEEAAVRRYLEGESTVKLGGAFGVSPSTIRKLLERHGIQRRSLSEAMGGLSKEVEAEICRRYVAGESSVRLGERFGVTDTTVGRILKRNDIALRGLSEAHGGLSPSAKSEVCRRYTAGESSVQLGAELGVSPSYIRDVLNAHGIRCRTYSEANGGLTPEGEAEVCRRYLTGESCRRIGGAFAIGPTTIGRILIRNGIRLRNLSEAHGGLTSEAELEVCRRYVEGESSYHLGYEFGVAFGTICSILARRGIERRRPGFEFGDSVQHVLDCTGRHTQPRECWFYLFSLARYGDTHCKPGIAFDISTRVDDEYGSEELRLLLPTRASSYFLEQAVQDATRGSADCPEDLQDWAGASEVRAMPASDMLPIVLRLADELEELGMWDFAARYVPMTAAQRATCRQRSELAAAYSALELHDVAAEWRGRPVVLEPGV